MAEFAECAMDNIVINWINAISTSVIAIVAISTAILTFYLFRENRLLRKAGTEPEVVAYLTMDSRTFGAINFVLANIGQGPARNVQFSFHIENDDFERHDILLANQADRKAVSVLPQGERIESFFGIGRMLLNEPRLRPFNVSIEYENIYGGSSKTRHLLDVSQFSGFSTLGKPPEVEIAKALTKIERVLSHSSTGLKRLKVETITTDEVRRDREQARKLRGKQSDSATAEPDRTQSK